MPPAEVQSPLLPPVEAQSPLACPLLPLPEAQSPLHAPSGGSIFRQHIQAAYSACVANEQHTSWREAVVKAPPLHHTLSPSPSPISSLRCCLSLSLILHPVTCIPPAPVACTPIQPVLSAASAMVPPSSLCPALPVSGCPHLACVSPASAMVPASSLC